MKVVFTDDAGRAHAFEIQLGRDSPLYTASFEHPERFGFGYEPSFSYGAAHQSVSMYGHEEAVEALIRRCQESGPVLYSLGGTAWEDPST